MPRILVVPERLEQASAQMSQGAAQLRDLEGQLGRALGGLDWEARQQANVEGRVNAARLQARQLAEQAEGLARYLSERAAAFRQADAQGSQAIGHVFAKNPAPLAAQQDYLKEAISLGKRISKLREMLSPVAASTVLGLSMKAGEYYPGEVIIDLPNWLKTFKGLREIRVLAGLPGTFNHFKYANLPSKMLQWGIVFSIPSLIAKWTMDTSEYQGTKLASAIIVDTALKLAPVVAGWLAAKAVVLGATALGTILFPGAGTAAGFAVGTAAATMISGTVANLATQWAIDHFQVRERAIEGVDSVIRSSIDEMQRVFHPMQSSDLWRAP